MADVPSLGHVGGSFLLQPANAEEVFTPEDLTEEHEAVAQTAEEFLKRELAPDIRDATAVLRRSADLGLTAVLIPEEYGGLELDLISAAAVADRVGGYGEFAFRYCLHTGPGTLPILWNGTDEQKRRYLPRIASGDWITACWFPDGHSSQPEVSAEQDYDGYTLHGKGLRPLNARVARLYTVLASGSQGSGVFLIERCAPGVEVNRGGQVAFNAAKASAGAVLGRVGDGEEIAGRALSIERLLLASAATGAAGTLLIQDTPLSSSAPAMARQALATMAISVFVAEAVSYRVAGLLDAAGDLAMAIREFAAECALARSLTTQALGASLDAATRLRFWAPVTGPPHSLAIWRHSVPPADRLAAVVALVEQARRGCLPLPVAAKSAARDSLALPGEIRDPDPASEAMLAAANAKRVALLALGAAFRRFGPALDREPEILDGIGRLVELAFAVESAGLRAARLESAHDVAPASNVCRVFVREALRGVQTAGLEILMACGGEDSARADLAVLRKLTSVAPANLTAIRRSIAGQFLSDG